MTTEEILSKIKEFEAKKPKTWMEKTFLEVVIANLYIALGRSKGMKI